MCKVENVNATAAAIESVDAADFMQRIARWQDELAEFGDWYSKALIGVLDSVMDEFFDCCVISM